MHSSVSVGVHLGNINKLISIGNHYIGESSSSGSSRNREHMPSFEKSQEIIYAHNPKVYNPKTKEWLILAKEKRSGQLAWVSTSAGMVATPPPDHIVAVCAPAEKFTSNNGIVGAKSAVPDKMIADLNAKLRSEATANIQGSSKYGKTVKSEKPPKRFQCKKRSLKDQIEFITTSGELKLPQFNPRPAKERRLKRCFSVDGGGMNDIPFRNNKRIKYKKPKHPKTGYNYFQLSVRDRLCKDIPQDTDRVLHNEKVARVIGQRWKALSAQERRVFQDMAEQDKVRYEKEMREYLDKMESSGLMSARSMDHIPSCKSSNFQIDRPLTSSPLSLLNPTSSILERTRPLTPSSLATAFATPNSKQLLPATTAMIKNRKITSDSTLWASKACSNIIPNNHKNPPTKQRQTPRVTSPHRSPHVTPAHNVAKKKDWGENRVRFVTSAKSFDSKQPSKKRARIPHSKLREAKSFDFSAIFNPLHVDDEPVTDNSGMKPFAEGMDSTLSSWLDDVFDDKADNWTNNVLACTGLTELKPGNSQTDAPSANKRSSGTSNSSM